MTNCHEMKEGSVYVCRTCGIELQVVKQCDDFGEPAADCEHHEKPYGCAFRCCGEDLELKEQVAGRA